MRAALHTPVAARASVVPSALIPRRAAAAVAPARPLGNVVALPLPLCRRASIAAHAAPANASTAKIIVTGRHVELTAPLKEYAVSRLLELVFWRKRET